MSADLEQDLEKFEKWVATAINSLSPGKRKSLFIRIGKILRKNNQKRISAQTDPEGQKWEPRKQRPQRGKTGQIRAKKKMMLGLRKARRMKLKSSPEGTTVGFEGRNAKIAAVHHTGGMDAVSKGGPKIRYPIRQMLGFSGHDRQMIRREIIEYVSESFS